MDRLAVALSTFWTSASARYPEQTFLGLCTALEALLSTQQQEITHQLAERAALVFRATAGADAVGIYKTVKKLYSTRSNIVHGRGAGKDDLKHIRKRQRTKARMSPAEIELLLHPMAHIVPGRELFNLMSITARLMRAMIMIDNLYEALRSGDDQVLDSLFLHVLLGSGKPPSPPQAGGEESSSRSEREK
jgi:hypothetical protein